MVCLHGAPGSHRDFRHFLAAFDDQNLRILALDLPGYGQTSIKATKSATGPALADCVVEFLDAMDLRNNVILVGHSFGGLLAMEVAAKEADRSRIAGLVLLCSAGLRPHRSLRPFRGLQLLTYLIEHPWTRPVFLPFTRFLYVRLFGFPSRTSLTDVLHAQLWIAHTNFDRIGRELIPKLQKYPLLGAYTKNDPLVETSVSKELYDQFPEQRKRILEFETGRHNIQKAKAPELAQWIPSTENPLTSRAGIPAARARVTNSWLCSVQSPRWVSIISFTDRGSSP